MRLLFLSSLIYSVCCKGTPPSAKGIIGNGNRFLQRGASPVQAHVEPHLSHLQMPVLEDYRSSRIGHNRARKHGNSQQQALHGGHDGVDDDPRSPLLDAEAYEAPPRPRNQQVQIYNDPFPQYLEIPELNDLPHRERVEADDDSAINLIPLSPQEYRHQTPEQTPSNHKTASKPILEALPDDTPRIIEGVSLFHPRSGVPEGNLRSIRGSPRGSYLPGSSLSE